MLRLKTDRFRDSWTVHTGPDARRIRREIGRERDAALLARDLAQMRLERALDINTDVKMALIAFCGADEWFRSIADTEEEIGRRLAEQHNRKDAA